MSEQDKAQVEEELRMEYAYDWFIDDNPEVIERVDRSRIEGRTEGALLALQRVVLDCVQSRFPNLALLAQQRLTQIRQVEQLNLLVTQLFKAENEEQVRKLLEIQGN